MSERFTEILCAASEPAWSDAVRHRFVNELFAGAVPDAVMARYLIQDHRFLDSFLTLLGATLASADHVRSQGFGSVASSAWCRARRTLFSPRVRGVQSGISRAARRLTGTRPEAHVDSLRQIPARGYVRPAQALDPYGVLAGRTARPAE